MKVPVEVVYTIFGTLFGATLKYLFDLLSRTGRLKFNLRKMETYVVVKHGSSNDLIASETDLENIQCYFYKFIIDVYNSCSDILSIRSIKIIIKNGRKTLITSYPTILNEKDSTYYNFVPRNIPGKTIEVWNINDHIYESEFKNIKLDSVYKIILEYIDRNNKKHKKRLISKVAFFKKF